MSMPMAHTHALAFNAHLLPALSRYSTRCSIGEILVKIRRAHGRAERRTIVKPGMIRRHRPAIPPAVVTSSANSRLARSLGSTVRDEHERQKADATHRTS
jgi:hypothetical protein